MASEFSSINNRLVQNNVTSSSTRPLAVRDNKLEVNHAQNTVLNKAMQPTDENQLSKGQTIEPVSQAELDHAVADINGAVQSLQRKLNFRVDEAVDGVVVIEVRDLETDEVIRQIPSDDAIRIAQGLSEAQGSSGLILSEKA